MNEINGSLPYLWSYEDFSKTLYSSNKCFRTVLVNKIRNINYIFTPYDYFYLSSLGSDLFIMCRESDLTFKEITERAYTKYNKIISFDEFMWKVLFQIRYLCKNKILISEVK